MGRLAAQLVVIMAEVVHRNLELMLPELEELERSGIFSPEEIKCVPPLSGLYIEYVLLLVVGRL